MHDVLVHHCAGGPTAIGCMCKSDVRPSNTGLVCAVILATDGHLPRKETNAAATPLLLQPLIACAQLKQRSFQA